MSTSKILRSAALLGAIVVLGAAALSAGGVDAAKGGKGGHQTPPPTSTVTITVSPNPVLANSPFTATFSGLVVGHAYNVYTGGSMNWLGAGDGTVTWYLQAGAPTTLTFTVYDITSGSFVQVGSLTFQVV